MVWAWPTSRDSTGAGEIAVDAGLDRVVVRGHRGVVRDEPVPGHAGHASPAPPGQSDLQRVGGDEFNPGGGVVHPRCAGGHHRPTVGVGQAEAVFGQSRPPRLISGSGLVVEARSARHGADHHRPVHLMAELVIVARLVDTAGRWSTGSWHSEPARSGVDDWATRWARRHDGRAHRRGAAHG
jgi:hypothetical protein